MQTSSVLFPALCRHIQEQQPHTQDLPHPLALQQRIHQQNAAQSLPLMPLVNGEVAEEYSGYQVGARWPGGGLRRQIGYANGMGIDGIALLASGRAT